MALQQGLMTTKKRQDILAGAESLLAERGAERTTMRAVAAAARVSLATLYKYFATKEQLIEELILARTQRLLARLEAASRRGNSLLERLLATLDEGHAAVRDDRVLMGLLSHGVKGAAIRRTVDAVEKAIDRISVALVEPVLADDTIPVRDPEALTAMARVIVHGWFASEAHRADGIAMPRITSVLATLAGVDDRGEEEASAAAAPSDSLAF